MPHSAAVMAKANRNKENRTTTTRNVGRLSKGQAVRTVGEGIDWFRPVLFLGRGLVGLLSVMCSLHRQCCLGMAIEKDMGPHILRSHK